MRQVQQFATMSAMTVAALGGGWSSGTDDPRRACIDRLLEAASTNTDSLPNLEIIVEPARVEERATTRGISAKIECAAEAGAANITYFVAEGDVDVDAAVRDTVALGDGLVIAEPGGSPEDRLEDPGETWSDVVAVSGLIDDLLVTNTSRIELALPDADRSPVRLIGIGELVDTAGDEPVVIEFVWQFADAETASNNVDELEMVFADAPSTEPMFTLDGNEVRAEIVVTRGLLRIPRPRLGDLALYEN